VARASRGDAAGPPELEADGEFFSLALAPYMLELQSWEPPGPTPEESRQEAERTWTAFERFPIPERARLLGMTLRAARSWALAERISHESRQRIARNVEEALELAALALSIAERVPGEESWRSRVRGYCWAHLAHARQAAGDSSGADEAFARARSFWSAGAPSDPPWLSEERLELRPT
jgi:hypothetical protein